MRIAVGADGFGAALMEAVKVHLEGGGHEVVDVGGAAERAYYDVAADVASRVAASDVDRGVLVCGTGMGMAIIANKVPGVYAAVCEDPTAASRARSINNANVLTMGGMVTAEFRGREIVDAFLGTAFCEGWNDEGIQSFLAQSMIDIASFERSAFGDSESGGE